MKSYIITFLIAMVPIAELRAAIPLGVVQGLDVREALITALIGNLVPVPFVILFIRKFFRWIRKKSRRLDWWITRFDEKTMLKAKRVKKYEAFGLLLFVAIPLPGTGAWTGAAIAAMLDMRLKRAVPMICLGVVIAGLIITSITYGITLI